MNKKPTAEETLDEKYCGHPDKIRVYNRITILKAMEAHANNAVEEKDKRIAELEQGIKKFIHHWRKYFDSPKVGQPPVLSDLEFILTNKD